MTRPVDQIDVARRATGIPVTDDAPGKHKVLRGHGFGTRTEDNQPLSQFMTTGKFGRMFPGGPLILNPEHLDELGNVMKDSNASDVAGDNDAVPAGFTYLGQFIDHDLTFDTTALQEILVDPLALWNFRTPALDLDCLYGSGPVAQPYLYSRDDNELFLIGKTNKKPGDGDNTLPTELPNDLPRSPEGFALIGDPRNDENLIVAQLHLAFLKFHNKVVEGIRNGTIQQESPIRKSPFEEARDLVIWHYQWIVLHDFLPRILDNQQLNLVLNNEGKRYYQLSEGQEAFMPVEFSAAAYRLGHTMVREAYDYNRVFSRGAVTPATLDLLFSFSGLSGPGVEPENGRPGVVPIPSDWIIDWRRFFEVGAGPDPKVNPSRTFDPFVAPQLHELPRQTPELRSLPIRNLRRGSSLGLRSGQSVAQRMEFEPLSPSDIAQGPDGEVAARHNLHIESPLWYYILKEAQIQGNRRRLGQVGSRIVAEVFVGILRADSSSFLVRRPGWKPTLPAKVPGEFTMADLLTFVGELSPIDDPANRL